MTARRRLAACLLAGALAASLSACPPAPAPDSGVDAGGGDDGGMTGSDAGVDAGVDAGAPDAGYVCIEDNAPASITARDGFIEVCASPATDPDARCGDGSPFKFTLRPATGTSRGLLLFFRGGGACDDYLGCWGVDGRGGVGRRVTTLSNTKDIGPAFGMGKSVGIFDTTEANNPFREYDQVHVSYCTGDYGEGTAKRTLTRPGTADPDAPSELDTYFHGDHNVRFALARAKARFASPARVVVYGEDAGGFAALHAVPQVVSTWPSVAVSVITEGAMGVGEAMRDTQVRGLLSQYDGQAGRPLIRFGQFTFISDPVQRAAAPAAFQSPAAFQAELRSVVNGRVAAGTSNYRGFAMDGACHTVALTPAYFLRFVLDAENRLVPAQPFVRPNPDLTVSMVSFDAWVKALVEGSGAFTTDVVNLAGAWATVGTSCMVP